MRNTAPERLRHTRLALGLSLERMAARLALSARWYTMIEAGERRPNLTLALRLQREYQIPVEAWEPAQPAERAS